MLVLFQGDNYGFSAAVLARSKAQCEVQGPLPCRALQRGCGPIQQRPAGQLVVGHELRCTSWQGRAKAGPASAASALGLACEVRLAVTDDKLPELAIITLKEH